MNNTHPKKQVYEILAAQCSYNNTGYNNVMNALSTLKVGRVYISKVIFKIHENNQ